MIFTLPIYDLDQIVRLMAIALDPRQKVTTLERKIALLDGVKYLIDADVYVWNLWGNGSSGDGKSTTDPISMVAEESNRVHMNGNRVCIGCAGKSKLGERDVHSNRNHSIPDQQNQVGNSVSNHRVTNGSHPSFSGIRTIADEGWSSGAQKRVGLDALSDSAFVSFLARFSSPMRENLPYFTWRREDCVDDATWSDVGKKWQQTGLNYSLFATYQLSGPSISQVSFHRGASKTPFVERDRAIVNAVIGQADWLHLDNNIGDSDQLESKLSRRERQVLSCLLRGRHKREIARFLSISEHTVGDYVKGVYKHFEVSSQAELQAKFLFGSESLDLFPEEPVLQNEECY